MKKKFRIPILTCESPECTGGLQAAISTNTPFLEIYCVECSREVNLGQSGAEIARGVEREARRLAKVVARALIEIRDSAPRTTDELKVAVRDPRHPFTAALLAGIFIILMEMSGFGVFMALSWILGNIVLNPLGWVLIVPIITIVVANRRIFERESFERISDELKDLQKRQEAGEVTPNEAEELRREILAQAFNRGAIDRLLREGGFEGDSVDIVKDAWRKGAIEWIRDDEHLTALFQAIRGARSHLYIYSGWVRSHVVDVIKTDLTAALCRGVDVYIGYGWESPSGNSGEDPNQNHAVEQIERIGDSGAQSGRIIVQRFRNHSKLLICDDTYVICGSANWLSNTQFHNREVSVRIEDEGLVREFAALFAADFPPSGG